MVIKTFKKGFLISMPMAAILLTGCAAHQPMNQVNAASIVTASGGQIINGADTDGTSQVGRYITASNIAKPDQINPLLTVATFKFAPDVQTVGQALNQVLQYSGYALVSGQEQSPEVQQTLSKPLPYSLRELGPIQIKDALGLLMGQDVFILVIDPLHRLVNFDLHPEIKNALYPQQQPDSTINLPVKGN